MNADELQAFLDENRGEIAKSVKDSVIKRLIEQHRWDISEQIAKVVNEFVASEVVPEVKAALAEQKNGIVDACIKSFVIVGDELAKGLAADATKHISDGYHRSQILKAIFNY